VLACRHCLGAEEWCLGASEWGGHGFPLLLQLRLGLDDWKGGPACQPAQGVACVCGEKL